MPYNILTYGSYNDVLPAWSPDGKQIAFATDRTGTWQIHIMDADGGNDKALTPATYNSSYPSWSPDSSRVAFWSSSNGATSVRIASTHNSTVLVVTGGGVRVVEGQPKWSPDGTRLLFLENSSSLELVSAEVGSGATSTLATVTGSHASATWTSGTTVAYSSLDGGVYEICTAAVGAGNQRCVLSGNSSYTMPVASPDGSRVAYLSTLVPANEFGQAYPSLYNPGDFNLWVSGPSFNDPIFQSGPTPTYHASGTTYPCPFAPGTIDPYQTLAWSPNGRLVAYTAYYTPYGTCIYLWDVVNRTSTLAPLGPLNQSISSPSWSPSNTDLAFAAVADGFYHIYTLYYQGPVPTMPPAERQ